MRFHSLHFVKYGKFTDTKVTFPTSPHDFHFIVGPNEAGKSSLRAAVQDLLYGIPVRSNQDFVHPLPELCLAAQLGDNVTTLEFRRIKANSNTLRNAADGVIPEKDLTAFLGASDRQFYDQMFGLDHTRLISGGKSILSAENNLGQILFQSAAGIAGLGRIRDALIAEADKLWAPRRAADREYYAAHDKLALATTSLKNVSIKAKAWADAHALVARLDESMTAESAAHRTLETGRNRLERLRRMAPHWAALREAEAQLSELGDVVDLPADAGERLTEAQQALATAGALLELRRQEVDRTRGEIARLVLDDVVLARAADITLIAQRCQQYRAYPHDIDRRKAEMRVLWDQVEEACRELGWKDVSAQTLRESLPPLPLRHSLSESALAQSGLTQAIDAADKAHRSREEDLAALTRQIAHLTVVDVPPELRVAATAARALGDTEGARRKQVGVLTKAQGVLETCSAALGVWRRPVATLAALHLPSTAAIARLEQERVGLAAEHRSATRRLEEAETEHERQRQAIAQFQARNHPVTGETVTLARQTRDASWAAIRGGTVTLHEGAIPFEAAMHAADGLADRRLDHVEVAAQLQTLEQALQRQHTMLEDSTRKVAASAAALHQFDTRWATTARAGGVPDMALDTTIEWLLKRQKVLDAAQACDLAQENFDSLDADATKARDHLVQALQTAGQKMDQASSLSHLCELGERFIVAADKASTLKQTLDAQRAAALLQARATDTAVRSAAERLATWSAAWSADCIKAGLPGNSTVGAVKGALELLAAIDEKMKKMRSIQTERIDTMNDDLAAFAEQVKTVCAEVDPDLSSLPAFEAVQSLSQRLEGAARAQATATRLTTELHASVAQELASQEDARRAQGILSPLFGRAGVSTIEELQACIAASDDKIRFATDRTRALTTLLTAGDGLTRAQIDAELEAADMAEVAADLSRLQTGSSASVTRQAALAAEHANAVQALAHMTGSDSAATAEAQRQEALSQMSDAAERFVKVATAARLLRWSIEKYRETKQGPMLSRASEIFSALTLGRFKKLHVDFDKDVMTLQGQRADARLVNVSGMSDGTRDQLYFALRIAALELHLVEAVPLPFIADDLFINYDDDRAKAGLHALKTLSTKTQVLFLSHHDHLLANVNEVFGHEVNVVKMTR